jgi:hypothetical protein
MLIITSVSCTSQKIAEIAHSHGAFVLVDNSIMSPVLSRPIELGAGIESYIYLTKKQHISIAHSFSLLYGNLLYVQIL